MALTIFLSLIALVYAVTFVFYIPLPDGICDRLKIQIVEQLLRISHEYMGDLVECLFGAKVRNYFMRCIISIPFLFKHRAPKWVTVQKRLIGNVPVRLYIPKKIKSEGLIFFIHGGGFAVMKPGYYDSLMYMFIKRLGIRIISIDYRLSPENIYPAAVEDCESVYMQLMFGKVDHLEFDKNRVCLMGDSAGGNLATVLAQRILKKKLPKSKCQVLVYPVIHAFDFHSPSYQLYNKEYNGTALLNPRMMARWYLLYLGIPATMSNIKKILQNQHIRRLSVLELLCEAFERHGYDPDFTPIMGKDLTGLCSAMIVTGGYDILRDEGVLYARHLKSYNVPVVWNHYKAAYHGVLNMPCSQQRRQIVDDIVAYIKSQLN
uniref:Abhydrolase_3 domain-containing protein n=1 Tax=Syphacia muris TaxID=451379 RepID=A0A0N5APF3_9BILA